MTELEKLKNAAGLIRDISQGKLEVRPSIGNNVFVHASDDSYIGLEMVMRSNFPKKCVDITFRSFVRRMGTPMTAKDLGQLQTEVGQTHALLQALEMGNYQPTHEDLMAFHDQLVQEQAGVQSDAPGMEMEHMSM